MVNYEIPGVIGSNESDEDEDIDAETFMHRVGRTGRFGNKGVCINSVCNDDNGGKKRLDAIQKQYSLKIDELKEDDNMIKHRMNEWLLT